MDSTLMFCSVDILSCQNQLNILTDILKYNRGSVDAK